MSNDTTHYITGLVQLAMQCDVQKRHSLQSQAGLKDNVFNK